MTISKTIEQGTMTVKVGGWLDIQSTGEFASFMKEVPVQEKLVLDLNELEYISSSGIREIVEIILRQPQGTFSIVGVNPAVMAVFNMIGLGKKVSITPQQ